MWLKFIFQNVWKVIFLQKIDVPDWMCLGRRHLALLDPILWPGLCRSQSRSHTSHNTESSPGPGGGHQIRDLLVFFHRYIDILVVDIRVLVHLTWELWSTYEKWRFQLFAGHNPRTNNGRLLSSVIQARSQRRELLSLIISEVYSSRYKINITVLVKCVYFICVQRNISDILVV